jgi:flagellar motility protein MotE (MotC chaperone)
MRTLGALIGLISFATLLAEGVAVGILALRGQLSSDSVKVIGAALSGETPQAVAPVPPPKPPEIPSAEEVETARTMQTLKLNARADELRLLKDLITTEAEKVKQDRAAYDKARKEFEERLETLRAQAMSEATEQTRSVVKAMPPREAVAYLLTLAEPDTVRIMKGLPERSVAKILQEFAAGADEERQRGEKVFEALSSGMPEAGAVDAAETALKGTPVGGAAPP